MITVILNGYKRKDYLDEQIAAIEAQTVKPTEILLWYNHPNDESLINHNISNKTKAAYCNHNFGVWSRFYFALNASNPYICILDDDAIPSDQWLENCMVTMNKKEGLLGTIGLIYRNPKPPTECSYWDDYYRVGWAENHSRDITQVDFVGHSWFFKKEWLSYYTRELPNPKYMTCGEDMHFSYMLQKYAGINTYVPPHPLNNKRMWGSTKEEYGKDKNSLWRHNGNNMNEFFREQRMKGWKLINEK